MTRPDTLKWLLPDDGHFSLEQLRLYQEENLSAPARHQVEKHLLDCDLCADVLAGMAVSNRTQTQVAVSQVSQRLKNKMQSESRPKVRPLYGPALRIAAGFLILLVSFGLFRYLQRPATTATSERTVAQSSPIKSESVPQVALSAPPDPVIRPTEPEPATPVAGKAPSPTRKALVAKSIKKEKPALAVNSEAKDMLFPVDTAVVLDAMAVTSTENPVVNENVPLPTTIAQNSLTAKRVLTGTSLAGKQIGGVALQGATTFTKQKHLSEVAIINYSEAKETTSELTRAKPQIGQSAFNQYIRENLRYPTEARQQKLEGTIEVGFTVTEEGQLNDFKISKSLHPACDAEAIRVIKEGPAWQPTQSQGQPQAENVRVTVSFKL